MKHIRLGVNIDHVATIRNARGGIHPDPVRAAIIAADAGADGITAHLREDRRHISDKDIFRLRKEIKVPLNLEMAATEEMLKIAIRAKPNAACIVPEKRQELTTEGGLNVHDGKRYLTKYVKRLQDKGIRVSLFIDADLKQIEAASALGADIVEFHTGTYCNAKAGNRKAELKKIIAAVKHADRLGIECHAGHGLSYDTVKDIAAIKEIEELNIGHFLIGEAIYTGLYAAVLKMRKLMDMARK